MSLLLLFRSTATGAETVTDPYPVTFTLTTGNTQTLQSSAAASVVVRARYVTGPAALFDSNGELILDGNDEALHVMAPFMASTQTLRKVAT